MKIAASWFAAFCGWATCWIALMGWVAWSGHWAGINDFEFLLWWTLAFTVIGWLVFGLPFLSWTGIGSPLLAFPWCFPVGALLSSLAYWVLIGWWLKGQTSMHLFGAGVGSVALPLYGAIARAASGWEPRRRTSLARALAVAPIALFLAFQFSVWPLAEHLAPRVVYRVASNDAQTRMRIRALRRVRVGDRLADLHARYPYVFEQEMLATTGNAGPLQYSILFRDGAVSQVRLWSEGRSPS
jgi:hypothetical protein